MCKRENVILNMLRSGTSIYLCSNVEFPLIHDIILFIVSLIKCRMGEVVITYSNLTHKVKNCGQNISRKLPSGASSASMEPQLRYCWCSQTCMFRQKARIKFKEFCINAFMVFQPRASIWTKVETAIAMRENR